MREDLDEVRVGTTCIFMFNGCGYRRCRGQRTREKSDERCKFCGEKSDKRFVFLRRRLMTGTDCGVCCSYVTRGRGADV